MVPRGSSRVAPYPSSKTGTGSGPEHSVAAFERDPLKRRPAPGQVHPHPTLPGAVAQQPPRVDAQLASMPPPIMASAIACSTELLPEPFSPSSTVQGPLSLVDPARSSSTSRIGRKFRIRTRSIQRTVP